MITMHRRRFLLTTGLLTGGALLSGKGPFKAGKQDLNEVLEGVGGEDKFWQIIRRQFIFPQDYIYLNTGGIGAVPSLVLREVKDSLRRSQIKPRPGHDTIKWNEIKRSCTGLLSPYCHAYEIALISTATEGINIILNGLPLERNDEIITSTHEHPAVHVPLLNLMQR